MRMSACWILAMAVLLAQSSCHDGLGDDRMAGRWYGATRLPHIRALLEVDVYDSRFPSIRAEVSLNPAPDMP